MLALNVKFTVIWKMSELVILNVKLKMFHSRMVGVQRQKIEENHNGPLGEM